MPEQLDLFTRKSLKRGTRPRSQKSGKKRPRKARKIKPDTRFGVVLKKKPAKRKSRKSTKKKKPGIASTAAFRRGFLAGIAARSHMKK